MSHINIDYTVKPGDTLSGIARAQRTDIAYLRKLNPMITNPDNIRAGWVIRVPEVPPKVELPPPAHSGSTSTLEPIGTAECKEELVDVVHITGDPDFHILTDTQSKHLNKEIDFVQNLMDELHQNLANALPISQCKKIQDPDASCACSRCIKDAWAIKAEGAGLLMRDPDAAPIDVTPLLPEEDFQEQLALVQEARNWYEHYVPPRLSPMRFESNWKALKTKKLEELDQQIFSLRTQLQAQREAEKKKDSRSSSTFSKDTMPDARYGKSKSVQHKAGIEAKSGITVVEVSVFSRPQKRYYVPARYIQAVAWKTKVSTRVMAGRPFNKQLAKDLMKDIKGAIHDSRKKGPLGNLELKIGSWASDEDNLLNSLHKEKTWSTNPNDNAPFAANAEAHAMRFAASASAGVNSWNPKEGNIDIGVKGSAAMSLAEGAVSLNRYFPDQGGYVANMAYRNAQGNVSVRPIGVFRVKGKLEFNGFAGVRVQGEAGIKTQFKANEGASGASALLGTPTIGVSERGGTIGVKANAFAGAQLGGALSGAVEWIEPEKQGTGKPERGQANDSSSWASLAEITLEGNVAVGAGATGEFGIAVSKNRLTITCSGTLVLGPGAGGGFGTVVDLEQVGKVALLLCKTLAAMDYRELLGVTEDAFKYLAQGLYQVATLPIESAGNAYEYGAQEMASWWNKKKDKEIEAGVLADYIIQHKDDKLMRVQGQDIPLGLLPPETIGPMVWLLIEGVIWGGFGLFSQRQEQALVILLSEVRSWRQFIEVLEHCCSPEEGGGGKVKAMDSLERINGLLTGNQQDQFNEFIGGLAVVRAIDAPLTSAWLTEPVWSKEKVLVDAKNSGIYKGWV